MPALPSVPSTIRVQWKGSWGTDLDLISRMYFEYAGTSPTATQCATLASAIETAWASHMAGVTNNGFALTEVIVEDLNSSSGASGVWSGSTAGTNGSTNLATNTAMLINFTIARRYRGGKPRVYVAPPGGSSLASPTAWTTAVVTAETSAFQAFVTAIIAAVWTGGTSLEQVNVSYYSGFTVFTGPTGRARNISKLRTAGPQVDPITGIAANGRPANQRRRLGKR